MYDDKMTTLCAEWKQEVADVKRQGKGVVIFGRGSTSELILETLEGGGYGLNVVAFCDNDKTKQGTYVSNRIPVISLVEMKEKYEMVYIYISTQLFYSEIKAQLKSEGIREENISQYDWIPQFKWEQDFPEQYNKLYEKQKEIYECFEDDLSRKTLEFRDKFLLTRKRSYAIEIRQKKQYHDLEVIDYGKIEHYIDVGTYIGDSIMDYMENIKVSNQLKVYGFEPDKKIYSQACDNTKMYPNVKIYNKGCADYCGKTTFQSELGVMQTLEKDLYKEMSAENEVEITTLDTIFDGVDNMTNSFLKMDVEGVEMSALKGARNFIKRNKPICAICVYHKKDDIVDIMKYLNNLVSEYKFYLRHYSDNQTETVLYAVM